MRNSIDRDMQVLYSLCEKVERIQNFERYNINEGRVSVLLEDVTQKDMALLNQVMQNFQKRINDMKKQLASLEGNVVSNEADAKAAMEFLSDFVNSYDEALKSLIKSAANADFTTGFWNSGWAKGMTIPGMVTVATTAASRLTEFIKGFDSFKDKMNKTVVSKLKPDQLEKSLFQLAEEKVDGLPDVDVVINFASQSFGKTSPGWWDKAKGVIKAIVSPSGEAMKAAQKNTAAVKAAIEKFPSSMVKAKEVGESVGKLFVNVKASSLRTLPAAVEPPAVAPLQQAISNSEKSKTQGLENMSSGVTQSGPGQVEVDGKNYVKSKKGNWYQKDAKDIAASAKEVQKNPELIAKINKAAGGKGPPEVETELSDDEKKSAKEVISKVRGKLSQGAQAELKKLGLFEESYYRKPLKEELLTSKRRKNSFDSNNAPEEMDRWKQLAGIK
jgi:hypothetical protein